MPPEQSTDDEPQTPVSAPRTSPQRKQEADLPAEGSPKGKRSAKARRGAAKSSGGDPEGLNPEEKPAENLRPPHEATAPYEEEPSPE